MAHQHAHARDAFDKATLDRIAIAVAEAERLTGAEIRVAIHDERETSQAGKSIAEVAKDEFDALEMYKTKQRNGILLLVLYSERTFYIYADSGFHTRTNPEAWTDVAHTLGTHFKEGHFEAGVTDALRKIAHHLRGILPKVEKSENELSNEVVVD